MDGVRWPLRLLFPSGQSDTTSLAEVHCVPKHSSSPNTWQTPAPGIIMGGDALGSRAELQAYLQFYNSRKPVRHCCVVDMINECPGY